MTFDSQIDTNEILQRIAVQPPYLSFSRLESDLDGTIRAEFHPEQPMQFELGRISAAEAGRHLAILGSCAAAISADEGRLFYLATNARFRRTRNDFPIGGNEPLRATAKVSEQGRRELVAETTISDESPFAQLTVKYQILTPSLFQRLFAKYRTPPFPTPIHSPYRELIPLQFDDPQGTTLTAHSPALSATQCAGHFPEFPAWPIALIMHSLGRVAGRFLHHIVGDEVYYTVTDAAVIAESLTFAVEPLSFRASLKSATNDQDFTFGCQAINGNRTVAELETVFRVAQLGNTTA